MAVSDVEALRVDLQGRVKRLQATLRYWQEWEVEYEGLKDELEAFEGEPSAGEIVKIGTEYGGNVVDEAEIKSIVNWDKKPRRSRLQVVSLIKGRMETGRRNGEVVQRQIDKVMKELGESGEIGDPGIDAGAGDLMEITEELDDTGAVVDSTVETYDTSVEHIQSVLRKQKLLDSKSEPDKQTKAVEDNSKKDETLSSRTSSPPKPSVHADVVEKEPSSAPPAPEASSNTPPVSSKVSMINDSDDDLAEEDSDIEELSSEDRLSARQELLRNMESAGEVVASMDLQLEDDSFSDEEYMPSDSDGEENEYGMNNIKSVLTDDYVQRMEELISKHSIANVGPDSGLEAGKTLEDGLDPRHASTLISTHSKQTSTAAPLKGIISQTKSRSQGRKTKTNEKKGVRFAEELDVSPAPTAAPPIPAANDEDDSTVEGPLPATMNDQVIERVVDNSTTPLANVPPRLSKFKAAKLAKQSSVAALNATALKSPLTNLPERDVVASQENNTPEQNETHEFLKNEFVLYRSRMDKKENQPDRAHFTSADSPDGTEEYHAAADRSQVKISRFKADRLGIPSYDPADEF